MTQFAKKFVECVGVCDTHTLTSYEVLSKEESAGNVGSEANNSLETFLFYFPSEFSFQIKVNTRLAPTHFPSQMS